MNFKSIFSTLLLLTLLSVSASAGDVPATQAYANDNVDVIVLQVESNIPQEVAGTCTVNIDATLDDGSTVSGTVVIEDIGWVQCALIKIADFFSGDF